MSLRPADMLKDDDKFYIQVTILIIKLGYGLKNKAGINKISGNMPKMIKEAGITSDKRLTNTSARKQLPTKLADHNIPDRQIVQISGHKNISCINHYAQMSRKRQNEISDKIIPQKAYAPQSQTQNSVHNPVLATSQHPGLFQLLSPF